MGVIPVNENDKGFNFDGESSKTFDLIITGGAIFDAPERDVELIEIPGRNGAYVQDLGRFKNVTVTYRCALTSTKEHEFVDAMRKVREWLCSKRGYCKLWDDFNPGEYRLAMFNGYIEVTNEAPVVGRFDLSFECKPQRFLLDGDNPVAVSDGGTIFNPTLFEAKPLLQVWGYGDIGINGEIVSVDNVPVGNITLAQAVMTGTTAIVPETVSNHGFEINPDLLETGDEITFVDTTSVGMMNPYQAENTMFFCYLPTVDGRKYNKASLTHTESGSLFTEGSVSARFLSDAAPGVTYANYISPYFLLTSPVVFTKGTAERKQGQSVWTIPYTVNGSSATATATFDFYIDYDGTGAFEMGAEISTDTQGFLDGSRVRFYCSEVRAYSTVNSLGAPLYFDLDIGEAYKEEGGEIISVNNAVSFPAELPVLIPGANAITFDNTITELDIVPRWWEV